MLEIKDLHQSYFYGTNALNGISFVLNDGEKLAVLSKNGGGKTSLLKCIAGLFPSSSGSIILDGKDITNLKVKDRGLRMVYDDGGLIRNRSVSFNLTYPLKLRKLPKNERLGIAYQTAKDYGLEAFFKEQAFRLFTPEIIALALARLELRDSSLTLIDDVFSIANGKERKDLFDKFLPKISNLKGNVIFATDSVEEAFSFSDKVLVLNNGYQDQIGTLEELKSNPHTLLVDEFVNPNKTRILCGVVDNVVEIDGLKLKIASDYQSNEVFVSYELTENISGYQFDCSYKKYIAENKYVFVNNAGEKFVGERCSNDTKVSIDVNSLKLFDRINEKLLTYELL